MIHAFVALFSIIRPFTLQVGSCCTSSNPASHKSNPSSVPHGYVDSYSTLPWLTWEVVAGVEVLL